MSIFDTQVAAASAETSVILQFMTESLELDYDEVNGRSISSIFEEYAADLGLTNVQSASFRDADGVLLNSTAVIQPGAVITASVRHDSKG